MGFRFRKSFGKGPFRVTFSKSGVGYSFGGKGARVTKKAGGGTRNTLSVPGTGISYVTDSGSKNKKRSAVKSSVKKNPYNIQAKFGLTDTEFKLFAFLALNFENKTFTQREVAEAGCVISSAVYANLYNKNILNKHENNTYSLNLQYINKIGEQFIQENKKGHSIVFHLFFGWIVLWIPAIYYTCSKKHYWHI